MDMNQKVLGKDINVFWENKLWNSSTINELGSLCLKGWQRRADMRHREGGIGNPTSTYHRRHCYTETVSGILTNPDTYQREDEQGKSLIIQQVKCPYLKANKWANGNAPRPPGKGWKVAPELCGRTTSDWHHFAVNLVLITFSHINHAKKKANYLKFSCNSADYDIWWNQEQHDPQTSQNGHTHCIIQEIQWNDDLERTWPQDVYIGKKIHESLGIHWHQVHHFSSCRFFTWIVIQEKSLDNKLSNK